MNCKECGTPNASSASVCLQCGQPLEKSKMKTGDLLIMAFAAIWVFAFFFEFIFLKLSSALFGYVSFLHMINQLLWAGANLSIVLPSATIQNKNFRIIAMVLTGIVGLYYAIQKLLMGLEIFIY